MNNPAPRVNFTNILCQQMVHDIPIVRIADLDKLKLVKFD